MLRSRAHCHPPRRTPRDRPCWDRSLRGPSPHGSRSPCGCICSPARWRGTRSGSGPCRAGRSSVATAGNLAPGYTSLPGNSRTRALQCSDTPRRPPSRCRSPASAKPQSNLGLKDLLEVTLSVQRPPIKIPACFSEHHLNPKVASHCPGSRCQQRPSTPRCPCCPTSVSHNCIFLLV